MLIMLCPKCHREITETALFCSFCGGKQTETAVRFKRDHGTGTISIDRRNRSRFIARGPSSPNDGRRKYLGSYSTFEKAEKALEEFIRKGCPDLFAATVGDIYSMWSQAHFKCIGKKTADSYRSTWKHFAPIENVRMADIRSAHIQMLVNEHESIGVASGIKTLAKALCRYAMENDILDKNYAEFVRLPKTEKAEKIIFTPEQIGRLWQHADDPNVQTILVMIYMGFRIGEMTGLTVDNIHLSEGYIIGGIKTTAGKDRMIPFPVNVPEIRDFVASFVQRAAPDGRLFPMTEHTFRAKIFYAALIKLGMVDAHIDEKGAVVFHNKRHLTPHSTRHTFASLSVAAGMQPERLQKIIGHASYRTTADYYVHIDCSALISEMGKLTRN